MKVLLTGGTGFLGSYILNELLGKAEKVYLLCRKGSEKKLKVKSDKIVIIHGDITEFDVIFSKDDLDKVTTEIDTLIHCAAAYSLGDTNPDAYSANVIGTQNICNLINKMNKIEAVHYISTYAVNDPFSEFSGEDFLEPDTSKLINPYSKSKNLSEKYLRSFHFNKKVKVRISRPGVIVGDSITGDIPKIDGPYYLIETIKKHKNLIKKLKHIPIPFPYSSKASLPLIPVDLCAQIIVDIVFNITDHELRSYHLLPKNPPSIEEIIKTSFEINNVELNIIPLLSSGVNKYLMRILDLPDSLIKYFYAISDYHTGHLSQDYPNFSLDIKENVLETLKKYQVGEK